MLLGWTGLVLSCTAQNPARLVYGSAALVASLRGQHCHFATLPIIIPIGIAILMIIIIILIVIIIAPVIIIIIIIDYRLTGV